MKALSIHTAQQGTQTFVLKAVVGIAATLLAAFLLGALLNTDWTLPTDPAIGSAFTA